MKIVNNLAKQLEKKKITGYRMSKDLNIPNQTIYAKFLKEDYTPSFKNALIIADYLGLRVDDIWKVK